MEQVHRYASWQPGAKVAHQLELVGWPPAIADKRGRDEHDGPEGLRGCPLGERVDQERPAYGVTDDDVAVTQVSQRQLDRRTPRRAAGSSSPGIRG